MYRRILVATDLSEASDASFAIAGEFPEATVGVVHVLPNLLDLEPLFPQGGDTRALRISDLEVRVLETLRTRAFEAGITPVQPFVLQGDPADCILEQAAAWNADLVVVASHGRSGISRFFLGSVASKVASRATCSVWVARPASRGPVLAATDLSLGSAPALRAAGYVAQLRNTPLHVCHVVDHALGDVAKSFAAQFLGVLSVPESDPLGELRAELDVELSSFVLAHDLQAERKVLLGSAARTIVHYADEIGAGLVVLGGKGGEPLREMLLGSVAIRVLTSAHASVLICRERP